MKKKLLRSVLFCPGNREKVLAKSLTLNADCFIYDLEDAVSPTEKNVARNVVSGFVTTHASTLAASCVVRVNCPTNTEWGPSDLTEISKLDFVDAVIIPKVESHAVIDYAIDLIKRSRPSVLKPLPIWTMIETPKGVLNAQNIAEHPLVDCLVFGSNDLTKELQAKHTASREPLLFSMSQCILAARAEKKHVIDGVHSNLTDMQGFEAACEQGRDLGFDGKTLIHPNQINTANDVYSPTAEDIQEALNIVAAWEEAAVKGQGGVISLNGRMIENMHVEQAVVVIRNAKNIGLI